MRAAKNWHVALFGAVSVVVLALTVWSFVGQPTPTLLGQLPHNDSWEHNLGENASGTSWWRIRCNLNSSADNIGPPLLLSAEAEDGSGHQLHWEPGSQTWRLVRNAPGPRLLAQGRTEQAPRRISLVRHGHRMRVRINGETVVECFDLLDPPPAVRWRLEAEYPVGSVTVDIHDDRYLAPTRNSEGPADIDVIEADLLRRLRANLRSLSNTNEGANPSLLQEGATLIEQMPVDLALETQLWAWWTWASGVAAVNRADTYDASAVDSVTSLLRILSTRETPPPQVPGMIMDLQRHLAIRAARLPEEPVPAAGLIDERSHILGSMADISDFLLELSGSQGTEASIMALTRQDRDEALLIAQSARVLSGRPTLPMPAEAPPWVAARVRAMAGTPPIPTPLPDLPVSWFDRPWSRGVLERLLDLTNGLEPLPAIRLRAALIATDAANLPGIAPSLLADSAADARTVALDRGILAAAGHLPPMVGIEALTSADEEGASLAERDPLAYAIYRLILRRHGAGVPETSRPLGWRLPPGLTPYRRLLSGGYGATIIAFARPGDTIPPPEAVAAALAMQEVSGIEAEWELVRRLPSLSLPLGLLVPEQPEPVSPFTSP